MQLNFKTAHNAVPVNPLTHFLSRLELKVMEKIRLKIREGIQTTPIEVTTSSSDVDDEEQFSSQKQTMRMSQKGNHATESTISTKCQAMGSK